MALRTGYSTGSYSAGKYGYPQIFNGASAVSVTSVVSQADAVRVKDSEADASCSLTVTNAVIRITSADAQVACTSTASGAVFLSLTGSSQANTIATVSASCVKLIAFSAVDSSSSDTSSTARYKWIDQTNASETWTESDYRGD